MTIHIVIVLDLDKLTGYKQTSNYKYTIQYQYTSQQFSIHTIRSFRSTPQHLTVQALLTAKFLYPDNDNPYLTFFSCTPSPQWVWWCSPQWCSSCPPCLSSLMRLTWSSLPTPRMPTLERPHNKLSDGRMWALFSISFTILFADLIIFNFQGILALSIIDHASMVFFTAGETLARKLNLSSWIYVEPKYHLVIFGLQVQMVGWITLIFARKYWKLQMNFLCWHSYQCMMCNVECKRHSTIIQ